MSQSKTTGKVFWALVRNDATRGWRQYRHGQTWRKFYIALAILLSVGLYTWAVLHGEANFELIFASLQALIIIPIVSAWQGIKREWRSGTSGWWLALPYSRKVLLGAKCIGAYLRYLRSLLSFFAVILFLVLEAVLLRPDLWNWGYISEFLGAVGLAIVWLLLFSPISILLGATMGVLQQSRWRSAMPILWLLTFFFGSGLNMTTTGQFSVKGSGGDTGPLMHFIYQPASYMYALLLLAAAVILYFFSAYVLERQVEA